MASLAGRGPYILAIDNGTQSVRALLFDRDGNLAAKAQVFLEAYYSDHPGWAEHARTRRLVRCNSGFTRFSALRGLWRD